MNSQVKKIPTTNEIIAAQLTSGSRERAHGVEEPVGVDVAALEPEVVHEHDARPRGDPGDDPDEPGVEDLGQVDPSR